MNKGKFFSAALYKENIKRFWSLAAIGFFIYFMSAPFTLLQSRGITGLGRLLFGNLNAAAYFVQLLLKNQNVGFEFVHLALPVASAVAVFSYLNRVNSVGAVHAMPFSRRMLFVTNYASGLTLSFAPYLINWAIVLALKNGLEGGKSMSVGPFFSWLLASFAIIIIVYSIAVLACIVSGNGVIATLTGFAFNFLVPAVMLCFYGYAAKFLTGFNGDRIWENITGTTPWLKTLVDSGGLFPLLSVIYIAVALGITVLSDVLYHVRQLERCGDSYVFNWMQTIIGFLFVFVITSLTGLVLFDGLGITAYIIGFIIGFLLGQMISLKTLHIFNRTSLRNLIIFAVIMALILAGFAFDLTGYKTRVPKASDVESAEVTTRFFHTDYSTKKVTEKETLEALVALHEELLANMDKLKDEDGNDSYMSYDYSSYATEDMTIVYHQKNGTRLSRSYIVPVSLLQNSKNYKTLCYSKEVLKHFDDIRNISADRRTFSVEARLTATEDGEPYYVYDSVTLDLTEAEKDKLLAAYADDLLDNLDQSFSDKVGYEEVCTIILHCDCKGIDMPTAVERYNGIYGFSGLDKTEEGSGYTSVDFIFRVDSRHTRTVQILKDKHVLQ